MRLLASNTDPASFIHRIQASVSYNALLFRVTGTSVGTAVFLRDLGRLTYRIRGKTVVDADMDMLSALVNIGGGFPETLGMGAVGLYTATVIIPRNYFDDNVEMVTPQDTAEFETQYTANLRAFTPTTFLSELYAIEEVGLQSYNLLIKQQELNIGGAGTIPDEITIVENIVAVYVSDIDTGPPIALTLAGSPITRLRYNLGSIHAGEFSTAAGLAKTNAKNPVEVAQTLLMEVFSTEVSDLSGALEDVASLSFTTNAAARPQVLALGRSFNPNKLADTAEQAGARMASKLAAKDAGDQKRTATVVRSLIGG